MLFTRSRDDRAHKALLSNVPSRESSCQCQQTSIAYSPIQTQKSCMLYCTSTKHDLSERDRAHKA